ncbi:MAG: VanZ family protein [Pseudomonadota bacterium]
MPSGVEAAIHFNDKIIHAIAYFSLMLACDFSWKSGKFLIIKAAMILFYSGMIEYLQSFVPGREMSMLDIVANAVGIGFFVLLTPLFQNFQLYQRLRSFKK